MLILDEKKIRKGKPIGLPYRGSKKNIVLISSYEISDDRFKCVYEFEKARSTMQSGRAGKTEKLFMAV